MKVALTRDKLILCEGAEDAAMIRALFAARAIEQTADVRDLASVCNMAGNGAFTHAIVALDAETSFDPVSSVLVIADNDSDPAASFANISAQFTAARDIGLTKKWGSPKQPLIKAHGQPDVTVWMWPDAGEQGCLETLLWRSVQEAHPNHAACAIAAAECSGANAWSISKRHKALIRCYFSLACQTNPGLTLAAAWNDPRTSDLIPLSHTSLDSFVKFLLDF